MKYLTIYADYKGTGIKDDFSGPMNLDDLNLSNEIKDRISKWLNTYNSYISKNLKEDTYRNIIFELDKEGIEISKCIKSHLQTKVKVAYYSDATGLRTII